MNELFEIYEKIPRVPQKLIPRLHKLCGNRYIDLLLHMPAGYLHRKLVKTFTEVESGETITVKAKVVQQVRPHNRKQPFKVYVVDPDNEQMELIFFNYGKWLTNSYSVGKELYITGVAERTLTGLQIAHPESYTANKAPEDVSGYFPVYPLTAAVTQNTLMNAIHHALLMLKHHPTEEWLDENLMKENVWPTFYEAIKSIHKPENLEQANLHSLGRSRLAFDELYSWQIAMHRARHETRGLNGVAHKIHENLRGKFLHGLPFKLTNDQHKTVLEIDTDMKESSPMLRLVQGDVGSGKTVVAFLALLTSIENGHQGAMMAPTEILAIQHFENAKKWLEPLGIKLGLLTGKLTAKEKREVKKALADGEIDILIGTHALIQDDVLFKKISLCVIDEQHRFGVKQRLALAEHETAPDLLVMTATPIPRTLALTAYGDMDISIIAEKPPGRTPIESRVFPIERLPEIVNGLKRVIDKKEQVYWICPLVEENEKLDLAAATDRYETLQQVYGDNVALLHGKMKGKEKESTLAEFKAGKQKILVSTTVVEVGVDVPQATVIIIEHAERFGLAQLHQLRGRVGRGELASNCMLLYASPLSQYAKQRLDTLRKSDDGFILAEKDLELRGPGEVLGTAQAGRFVTRVASMFDHRDLIPQARDLAREKEAHNADFILRTFKKDKASELMSAG